MKKLRFLISILIMAFILPSTVKAADSKYIRVGLRSNYQYVANITIKTTKIAIGYCINSSYYEDKTFESKSGFKFSVAKGYYYELKKSYNSYSTAKKMADMIKKLDVNAYPVVLYRDVWKVYVGGSTKKSSATDLYKKIKGKYGLTYTSLKSDNNYRVKVSGDTDTFLIDVDSNKAYPQFISKIEDSSSNSIMDLSNSQYRGRIEIGRYKEDSLIAVNVINIEEYLYGVVPSEMSSTWHSEALKAQAVCARGYAYDKAKYHSISNADSAYTLDDTTACQVYKGYSNESSNTNKAVNDSKGQMVYYNNKVANTFFYSTSGGATEAAEDVWSDPVSYLRSVPDIFENNPSKLPWILPFTKDDIKSKLASSGIVIGDIVSMYPEIMTPSGRILSLKIQGTKDNVSLQKEAIRTKLSLFSTKVKVVSYGDKPDKVVMKSTSGTKTKRIGDSYVIDGSGQVKKASQTLEQYIVLSEDNRTNFPRVAPKNTDTFYLAGQGYGHGVGLSQSGARGMAESGYNYKEILEHYFSGVVVK